MSIRRYRSATVQVGRLVVLSLSDQAQSVQLSPSESTGLTQLLCIT